MVAPSLLAFNRAPVTVSPTVSRFTSGTTLTALSEKLRKTSGTGTGSTTIAAGSDGAALPQATINVVSTAAFSTAGFAYIEVTTGNRQLIQYTGKNATQLTGCTGGTGTMNTGEAVEQAPPPESATSANASALPSNRVVEFKGREYCVTLDNTTGTTVPRVYQRATPSGDWTSVYFATVGGGSVTQAADVGIHVVNSGNTEYLAVWFLTHVGTVRMCLAKTTDGTSWTEAQVAAFGNNSGIACSSLVFEGNIYIFIASGNTNPSLGIISVGGNSGSSVTPSGSDYGAGCLNVFENRLYALRAGGNSLRTRLYEITAGGFVQRTTDTLGTSVYTTTIGEAQRPVLFNSQKKTTVAAGSNGLALPQATIYVGSNSFMPNSGRVKIRTEFGYQTIAYTGKSGSDQITGCSGGTGTLTTDAPVYYNKMVGIFLDFNSTGSVYGNVAYDFHPSSSSFDFTPVDVSNPVLGATAGVGLRAYATTKNDHGWVCFVNNEVNPAEPSTELWYFTGSASADTANYYSYVDSATEMGPGTVTGINPNNHCLSVSNQGGGERINTSDTELYIHDLTASIVEDYGQVEFSFKCSGGSTGLYLRAYVSVFETGAKDQMTLTGTPTGGSVTRNGNQLENIAANGSTVYTFRALVSADYIQNGQPTAIQFSLATA